MSRIYEALKRAEELRVGSGGSQSQPPYAAAAMHLSLMPSIRANFDLVPPLNYPGNNVCTAAWVGHKSVVLSPRGEGS